MSPGFSRITGSFTLVANEHRDGLTQKGLGLLAAS
jgi:hypothetical protein